MADKGPKNPFTGEFSKYDILRCYALQFCTLVFDIPNFRFF